MSSARWNGTEEMISWTRAALLVLRSLLVEVVYELLRGSWMLGLDKSFWVRSMRRSRAVRQMFHTPATERSKYISTRPGQRPTPGISSTEGFGL